MIMNREPVDRRVFSPHCIWHHARVLRRPLLLAAPCLALVLGTVVGCGHDDKPYAGPLPSKSSASPTPTKSHTKAPPKPTAQSAIATAEQADEALNTLYLKQDGKPLRAVSNVSCGKCESFYHSILTHKAHGYRFSGGQTKIIGPPRYGGMSRETMTGSVSIPVSIGELRVTDPSGKPYVSKNDPAGGGPTYPRLKFVCMLYWDGSRWLLQDFDYS
jgi:hypothetical protein